MDWDAILVCQVYDTGDVAAGCDVGIVDGTDDKTSAEFCVGKTLGFTAAVITMHGVVETFAHVFGEGDGSKTTDTLGEERSELVGCALHWRSGWVKDIAVAESQRGRGLGTALLLGGTGTVTPDTIRLFLIGLPALLLGSWVGLRLYGRLDEAGFRKVVLSLLLVSGIALVAPILFVT